MTVYKMEKNMKAVGNLEVPFPGTAKWRYDCLTDTVSYSSNLHSMLDHPEDWEPYKLTDLLDGARTDRHGDRAVRRFLENPFLLIDESGFIKLTFLLQNGKWYELKVTMTESDRDIVGYEARIEPTSAPDRPDTDDLTGLNVKGLVQRLAREALAEASPTRQLAYYRLDLDFFKIFNLYGHQTGDKALVRFAEALVGVAEKWGDIVHVGRASGDEFIAIGIGLTSDQITLLSDDLLYATNFEISVDYFGHHHTLPVIASIGMVECDGSIQEIVELDNLADCAQGWAKGHKTGDGTNRLVVYSDGLGERSRDSLRGIVEIRNALLDQEIAPRYEPLVDSNFRMVGVEALSRWHRHTRTSSPDEYLKSLASLITEHDLQILHMAAADVFKIEQMSGRRLKLHTNITPAALGRTDFVNEVLTALETTSLDTDQLVLEVVELDGLPPSPLAKLNVRTLMRLGVGFALDDYPTGMSSTLRLMELPYFKTVKLSGEMLKFISLDKLADEDDERMRQAALAHLEAEVAKFRKMNIAVIAEHVTSPEMANYLSSIGVNLMQGYLFGSAMLEDEDFQYEQAMDRDKIVRWIEMEEELSEDSLPALFSISAVSA
jgi:diguanylate cyclase (GGDEF)-like protein